MHKHNNVKRFYGDDKIYFIVTKTWNNFPYFENRILCSLFIEELRVMKTIKGFKLYGFSVIPDHVNLIIQPNNAHDISHLMQSIKKHFSRDVNDIMLSINNDSGARHPGMSPTGGNFDARCKSGKQYSFKLKQDFGLPDLSRYRDVLSKDKRQFHWDRFKWQKSFYDHVIRGPEDFKRHWRYTVYNDVKHGLADEWPYTSLNYEDMIDAIEL